MPATEALLMAAPKVTSVWAKAGRARTPAGIDVPSAGADAAASAWWTGLQNGSSSNQVEMDAAIKAIDDVVLLLPEDVWGLDKLRRSQRAFLQRGAGSTRNFQTIIQRRINTLFVSVFLWVPCRPITDPALSVTCSVTPPPPMSFSHSTPLTHRCIVSGPVIPSCREAVETVWERTMEEPATQPQWSSRSS